MSEYRNPAVDLDDRLYDIARAIVKILGSGPAAHELRSVLRDEIVWLCGGR